MKGIKMRKYAPLLLLLAGSALSGCANYEINTMRGNIPGHYIRYEMQEADRAVESARQAGKDRQCPAEFKAAEDAKNHAYDIFRACHTEEGAALAKQATAKANALCPPVAAKAEPAPAPAPAAKPVPPAAPVDNLSITPASVVKGETATLTWTSANATSCEIQPGIGPVPLQGSLTVTPSENRQFSLICNGAGGTATSTAAVAVTVPAPKPEMLAAQPKASATQLCSPAVIDIKFDTNKADIKPQFHDELKKLADFLKENPKATGTIEGHTDSVGSKEANMKLSQRRAESVRSYLIKKFGIESGRVGAKGYGPTKPVADNKTAAGKQKNRRIEANFSCN